MESNSIIHFESYQLHGRFFSTIVAGLNNKEFTIEHLEEILFVLDQRLNQADSQ
jgi:hypothetical protein